MRIAIATDTHLSSRVPDAEANWDAVVHHVNASSPDLLVHLGDLSFDGANDAGDLRDARAQLERVAIPWRAVPGNHDVGENPGVASAAEAITEERRERWLACVGPDHWHVQGDDWRLLAVNAQLFGSRLASEEAQWQWLGAQLEQAATARERIALFIHKPLFAPGAELATAPSHRFVSVLARQRLGALFASPPPALVASGHIHQYRLLEHAGTRHLWVPTAWAVLKESAQPTFGLKRCGIVEVDLRPGGDLLLQFVEPQGLRQLTLGENTPDPYVAHGAERANDPAEAR